MFVLFCFDEFELDVPRFELRRGAEIVKIDPLVLRLLVVLVRNAGRLVTKDQLVAEVWNSRVVPDNVITVTMTRLRKALGTRADGAPLVVTVYGRGYRFEPRVKAREAAASQVLPMPIAAAALGPPFVGRERVIERLRSALADMYLGRGRGCLLLGAPGIGKTRIVERLEQELASTDARVAWGFCREDSDTPPLQPWLRILRKVHESPGAGVWMKRLGSAAHELRRLLDEGAMPVDANTPPELRNAALLRTFDIIARALSYASERTPWVLVLDDLHRADAASLELMTHLLDELSQMRVLIVAAVRSPLLGPDHGPYAPLQYVLGHRNVERIALEPLCEEDVSAYVAALVDDLDGRWGRAVFATSEGNPFIMSELVKQFEGGDAPSPDGLGLPAAALDIVRRSLTWLSPDTRALLSIAAVLGRTFELWLLQAVSERETTALAAALDEAMAAELVVAASDSHTGFAFRHELVRVVLYDELPRMKQRRCHRRTAEALELRQSEAIEVVAPATLAYHFYAAMPATDLEKTVHYCREAARAATSICANDDIARYVRNGLDALALMERPNLPLRLALLLRLAVHRRAQANVFIPTIAEVVRLARDLNDGFAMMMAGTLGMVHPELVHLPSAADALTEALALLPPERTGMRAMALGALACTAPSSYARERAHALLDQAEQLVRTTESLDARCAVLLCRLYLRGGPSSAGDAPAEGVTEELERLARMNVGSMPIVPLFVARYRAVRALQQGDMRASQRAIASSAAAARTLNQQEMLWHCDRARVLAELQADPGPEALAMLEPLHQRAMQQGVLGVDPFCAFDRMVILGELGGDETLLDDATRRALRHAASDPPSIWALKVRALQAAGLHGDARASLAAVAPGALALLPHDSQYLGTLGHLARAALALGDRAYVEALAPLLAPHRGAFAAHVAFFCEGTVAQLSGMLFAALGQAEAAILLLEEGVAGADQAGLLLAAADARLELACSLRRSGADRRRVLSLAREAHEICERSGMSGRLARMASALLRDAPCEVADQGMGARFPSG